MILGIGVDWVEVVRLERAVARQGEEFLSEFLVPSELDSSRRTRYPLTSCSLLFAIKEAVFKALGTGKSGHLRWHDIEATRGASGAYALSFRGETARIVAERRIAQALVSAAATRDPAGPVAIAMVVLVG